MTMARMDPFSEVDRRFDVLGGSENASRHLEREARTTRCGSIRATHGREGLGVLTGATTIGAVR